MSSDSKKPPTDDEIEEALDFLRSRPFKLDVNVQAFVESPEHAQKVNEAFVKFCRGLQEAGVPVVLDANLYERDDTEPAPEPTKAASPLN